MPGVRTTGYIVQRVRDKVGIQNKARIVDGYTSEAGLFAPAPSIIRAINAALSDLNETGYNKCEFTVVLEADRQLYLLSRQAHEIEDAWVVHISSGRVFPLNYTSEPELTARHGGAQWRNRLSVRPSDYFNIGTKVIGAFPMPYSAGHEIHFIAKALVPDVEEAADIPTGIFDDLGDAVVSLIDGIQETVLSEEFFEDLAEGAAAYMLWDLGRRADANESFARWGSAKKRIKELVNSRQRPVIKSMRIHNPMSRRHRGFGSTRGRW